MKIEKIRSSKKNYKSLTIVYNKKFKRHLQSFRTNEIVEDKQNRRFGMFEYRVINYGIQNRVKNSEDVELLRIGVQENNPINTKIILLLIQ